MMALKIYQNLLKNHFLLTQAVQTGVLMTSGDCIAQVLIEKKPFHEYELKRTATFAFLGTTFVGPTLTIWYRLLSNKFGTKMLTSTTLKKVACDQLIFAPTFIAIFIMNLNLLNGKNFQQIKDELSVKYRDVLYANWKIWPAVQIINFYFVPLTYQVLSVQSVALLWNVYLSWKVGLQIKNNKD